MMDRFAIPGAPVRVFGEVKCFGCGGNHKMDKESCMFFRWFDEQGGIRKRGEFGTNRNMIWMFDNQGFAVDQDETVEVAFVRFQFIRQAENLLPDSRLWFKCGCSVDIVERAYEQTMEDLRKYWDFLAVCQRMSFSINRVMFR